MGGRADFRSASLTGGKGMSRIEEIVPDATHGGLKALHDEPAEVAGFDA